MPTPYIRRMVILQEDQTGYRADASRPCAGRALLEATGSQGKATISVQNLKPNTVYTLYIIEADETESIGVPLGRFTTEANGKATVRLLFNADADAAHISNKTIVALIAADNGPLVTPLVGAVNRSVSGNIVWRGNFKEYVFPKTPCGCPEENTDAIEPPAPIEASPEDTLPPQDVPPPTPYDDVPTTQEFFSVLQSSDKDAGARFADTVERFLKSGEMLAAAPSDASAPVPTPMPVPTHTPTPMPAPAPAPMSAPTGESDDAENHDNREGALDIWYLFDTGTPVRPFEKQNADVQWIQIGIDELAQLPFQTQRLLESEFVQNGYETYRHFILGKLSQGIITRFILGVPGRYDEREHRAAARLGFRQFKTLDDSPAATGTPGYWLLVL